MSLAHDLLMLLLVHLLAAASSGPDFVLVSQQTLNHGRRIGFGCSVGIALGLFVHILYSALGLAAVIAHSESALWWLRTLGGGYLLYLGYKGLRTKVSTMVIPDNNIKLSRREGVKQAIAKGFFCNVLNPKAPVYFVALFTLVLSPAMPLWQLMLYGSWLMVIQLGWFSLVVALLSAPMINHRFKRFGHYLDRIFGGVMIALGLRLLLGRSS